MLLRSLLGLIATLALAATTPQPVTAADAEVPGPGAKDRCAVCGMFVAPFPNWVAAVVFEDGTIAYFDGPKDMFRYAFAVETFDSSRKPDQIRSLWVTEYYTTTLMPAAELFFVVGSDVLGPMGHELVPIRGQEAAQTFSVDHHGSAVHSLEEITSAVLSGMP